MNQFHQLGRYQIEAHLGTGAYADVYRALDTALKRTVALKVLKPMLLADEDAFARFVQEAQAAAGLFHPQIATVLDLGEAEGRFFLAMRYVDGVSLAQHIAENGPLAWDDALRITEQIADALGFAHGKGFIHRDVKPQNILISESEGAFLTDFGLVKAIASSGMTTTGSFLGTPHYMAPEIWQGVDVTPATDQYALACVLCEMLTGEVLYVGKTPPVVMAKHFQPPPLPESWPEKVPVNITDVLCKALTQDQQERYAGLDEFVTALKLNKALAAAEIPRIEVVSTPQPILMPELDLSGLVTPDNPAGIEWIEIPAGEFLYGEEKKPFYIRKTYQIGKYPVTNAQYQLFLDANPDYKVPDDWDSQHCIYPPGKEHHPVVHVNWHDAQAFCRWANCRLPTEQEWEKAARSTDGRVYPWGNEWVAGKFCNSADAGIGTTTPVDEFPEGVSPYGVLDMSGNVWEWTESKHEAGNFFVLRGGSWSPYGNLLRVANRHFGVPSYRNFSVGFRCARSP
jgi:serine/threonine protein kinase